MPARQSIAGLATSPSRHPEDLAEELDLGPVATAVDVIVGGPPCQAFARVGRSKLREIDEHPEAFKHDPRARLYQEYLRYVDVFRPLAVLMENVPDVLNHGGGPTLRMPHRRTPSCGIE
jgi:DNA (cytosine-5)-methyltransferase 1